MKISREGCKAKWWNSSPRIKTLYGWNRSHPGPDMCVNFYLPSWHISPQLSHYSTLLALLHYLCFCPLGCPYHRLHPLWHWAVLCLYCCLYLPRHCLPTACSKCHGRKYCDEVYVRGGVFTVRWVYVWWDGYCGCDGVVGRYNECDGSITVSASSSLLFRMLILMSYNEGSYFDVLGRGWEKSRSSQRIRCYLLTVYFAVLVWIIARKYN